MAGENIDLGTFSWDISQIEKQLIDNRVQLEGYNAAIQLNKKQLTEQRKTVQEVSKVMAAGKVIQEELNKAHKEGSISQEDYAEATAKVAAEVEEAKSKTEGMAQAQAELIKQNLDMEQSVKAINNENKSLITLLSAGRTEVQQNETAYKDLNKELNALKLEAKNLGAQMVIMERAGQDSGQEYDTLRQKWQEVSAQATELNDDFKKLDKAVGDNQRSVGDYKDQIKEAASEIGTGFNQILSGDVTGGMETLKSGISGVTANLKGLFVTMAANPIGAVVMAVAALAAGLFIAGREVWSYNENISEAVKKTEDLTGVVGDAADKIRVRAQSISTTFGDEFDEVLKTANALSQRLGISFDEAFNSIEAGYVRGANSSGDFLERLREYAPLLQQFGFDINEIIGLQVQAQQAGFFNDKFEDSLKEAGLSLTEFTKTQADALNNAFGAEFGEKIFKAVNSGAMSVKDALLLMGSEAKKQGLSVQQTAQLTADIFKGAGEDAAGARVILEEMYEGINKLDEPLTKQQQLTQDLADANTNLAMEKDKALKSDSLIEFQKNLEIFWVKAQTIFYGVVGAISDAVVWLDDLTGAADAASEAWDAFTDYAQAVWDLISNLVDTFSDLFEALGLNSSGTKGLAKEFFAAINPLNVFKVVIGSIGSAIKSLSVSIDENRVKITAFALTVKSVMSQISNALKGFDITKPLESLNKLKDISISATYKKVQQEAQQIVKSIKTQESYSAAPAKGSGAKGGTGGTDPYAADKEKATKAAASARSKAQKEAEKAARDAEKRLEEEAKKAQDIAKQRAENSLNVAKSELAEYISLNAEKYKDDKRLSHAKLQDQLAYFDEVKRQQEEINALERKGKEASIKLKLEEISAKEAAGKQLTANDVAERQVLNEQISAIDQEYKNRSLSLENQTNEKKKEINLKYAEAIAEQEQLHRAIQYQQELLDLETQGANEFAMRQVQLEQATQQDLDEFLRKNELLREFDADEYDLRQQIQLARKELTDEIALTDDENERLRLQNQLGQLNLLEQDQAQKSKQLAKDVDDFKVQSRSQVLGSLASLFGEESMLGKAFALAQITNDTVTNASKAFTQASVFAANPLTAALAPNAYIQGGIIIATGAAQAAKLVMPKKKMWTGGYTGSGGKYDIANDIEVHRGEMIWSAADVRAVGGADVANAMRPSQGGFMLGGMQGSSLSNVQAGAKAENISLSLPEQAVSEIADAIYAGAQNGLADMAENRSIQAGADL